MMADQDGLAERDDIGHFPRSGQARLAFCSQGARALLKALFARGLSLLERIHFSNPRFEAPAGNIRAGCSRA
jgi:hypothetical protein